MWLLQSSDKVVVFNLCRFSLYGLLEMSSGTHIKISVTCSFPVQLFNSFTCSLNYLQSTLMQMVSGRARGKRFQKRKAEKVLDSSATPSSKRPSLGILVNANVKVDTSSAMTDELYEYYKKECKQGVGRSNNSDLKAMLRATYERR